MSKVFIDTNVLVSSIDTTRINHKKTLHFIDKVKSGKFYGFISTQVIGEFYVSLTKATGGINSPLTSKEADDEILQLLFSGIFTVLPVTESILKKAVTLSSNKDIKGIRFWDVVVVSTMLENDVVTLYTENYKDFKKFSDIIKIQKLDEIEM